ncbi:hypothetical protein [Cedratvirus kamchatka]|uniref:Uncharacterized protein n=1 Tax=Cedratvirus kamchatka TaxID=2716914 RepID=A0A6G8MX52_9VIRU|nr:hypothetical protein [Cedratvirus kamchatka]
MIAPLVFAILIALVLVFLVLTIAYFVFPASPSASSVTTTLQNDTFTLRLQENLVVEGESTVWQVTIPSDGNWIILSSFYILPVVNSRRFVDLYLNDELYSVYESPSNAVSAASLTPVAGLPLKQGDLVIFRGRNINNPFTLQADNTFVSFTKT